jgi:hypothetical protein
VYATLAYVFDGDIVRLVGAISVRLDFYKGVNTGTS